MSDHIDDVKDFVTLENPLGPHETEPLVGKGQYIFQRLYDGHNGVNAEAMVEHPYFVVGRKGAGKTAFLLGTAFAADAKVELLRSEDIYSEVQTLKMRYEEQNGALVADRLAYAWEVLLFHAAMLAILRGKLAKDTDAYRGLWSYMTAFGHPERIRTDDLMAAVSAEMTEVLINAAPGRSFRHNCWSIQPGLRSFADAVGWVREIVEPIGAHAVYVVVDNLEDLHKHLDDYESLITALFRLVSRSEAGDGMPYPFSMRFAFPAEMLPRLSTLAANADKDFKGRQTIRWTAQELIGIAGNRLRTFLDLYFPGARRRLGLSERHDLTDHEAATRALRALLPDKVENGLGGTEDAVAYVMRHTQLLPRHLIQMLNFVMRRAVAGRDPAEVPQATPDQVIGGVKEAELEIVSAILTSYSHEHDGIAEALGSIRNRIGMVETMSDLHGIFNEAGGPKTGWEFGEFWKACIKIGVFGIVDDSGEASHARYTDGKFSYTFIEELRPVEGVDSLCVHPLFVSQLCDMHTVARLAAEEELPVYPYGADPRHRQVHV